MDKTCKSCKFWNDGECEFVTLRINGHGDTDVKSGNLFEVNVCIPDDWNLNAVLNTGPDFGCIHHDTSTVS